MPSSLRIVRGTIILLVNIFQRLRRTKSIIPLDVVPPFTSWIVTSR